MRDKLHETEASLSWEGGKNAAQFSKAPRWHEDDRVEDDDIEDLLNDDLEDEFLGGGSRSPVKVERPDKTKLRRKSSLVLEEPEKKKEKGSSCHLCNNPPQSNSLYCSDACIITHTSQALAQLSKVTISRKYLSPPTVTH